MTVKEEHWVDKSGWPAGPWMDEPDRVEWYHEDLPCLMVRHAHMGHFCGYVAVPPGHPWYGTTPDLELMHDISLASLCQPEDAQVHPLSRLCHVPRPGEPDNVWWVGFHCGDTWDYKPGYAAYEARLGFRDPIPGTYRTVPDVRAEVDHLADLALAAASGNQEVANNG